jgi:hypothetical protein
MKLYPERASLQPLSFNQGKMLILLNQKLILMVFQFGNYAITRYNHASERQ